MEKCICQEKQMAMPSLSLRDISPRGRDKFGLRVKKPSSLRKVARRKP